MVAECEMSAFEVQKEQRQDEDNNECGAEQSQNESKVRFVRFDLFDLHIGLDADSLGVVETR